MSDLCSPIIHFLGDLQAPLPSEFLWREQYQLYMCVHVCVYETVCAFAHLHAYVFQSALSVLEREEFQEVFI